MARSDCPVCSGTGWKVVDRESDGPRLPGNPEETLEGPSTEAKSTWAVPCDCTTGDRTDRILAKARIPERYRHCDFENFETDNEIEHTDRAQMDAWNRSLSQAKLIVKRFADEFCPLPEAGTQQHGLLLIGPCGVGKTHLAVAALKQIVLRGYSGLFYDYRELLKQIQDSFNPQNQATEMSVLEPVLKTEILVLDDVGSSIPSPWALETVGHILNTRYNQNRVTILTTNYLDSDSLVGDDAPATPPRVPGMRTPVVDDSLTRRVGKRIRSRLYEMCRTVEVTAPDYRKEIRRVGR